MRSTIAVSALCVLLASCSFLPPRLPLARTPVPAPPTAAPVSLTQAHGSGGSYLSPNFFTPPLGWLVIWRYDCSHAGKPWTISLHAREAPYHGRPATQLILRAGSGLSGARRPSPATARGSAPMIITGKVYIDVQASKDCTWSAIAKAAT
ncbi:MAG: hypothetical protein ACR2JC_04055 [Chloroflexota bacterium]